MNKLKQRLGDGRNRRLILKLLILLEPDQSANRASTAEPVLSFQPCDRYQTNPILKVTVLVLPKALDWV